MAIWLKMMKERVLFKIFPQKKTACRVVKIHVMQSNQLFQINIQIMMTKDTLCRIL